MTEVGTIAGAASAPNGIKPNSPDENPGAPEMDRGHRTPVPGMQPQPDFGATDPAASSVAPASTDNGRSADPFAPTPPDAEPTKTVDLSSSGADNTAQQDKDADQARKDEAGDGKSKDAQTEGKSFADIRDDAKQQASARRQERVTEPMQAGLIGGASQKGSVARARPMDAGDGRVQQEPGIGRIVHYKLTQDDADRINTRRVYGPKGEDGSPLEEGGSVQAGVVYPAIITGVGDQVVNLHVFADGNHGVWLENVKQGGDGGWSWPQVTR